MRTVLLIVLFCLCFTPCYAMDWSDTTAGVHNDKWVHVGVGFTADYLLSQNKHISWLERKGIVVIIGAGKEIYDKHWDGHDFIATIEGALLRDLIVIRF